MGRWQASRLSSVLVILFLHNAVGFFSHQLQGHLSRPRSRGCTLQMKASAEPSREELKKSAISEGVEEILASRALEASERAVKTWEMQTVDFCRPPEVAILQRVLGRMSDLKIVSEGGYPQAERTRLFFFRDQEYVEPDVEEMRGQLQAVKIEGNFVFDKASHRDFLGAILGTGIVREKVGDIILQGERGAQVMVVPEIAEYLCGSLKAVRSVPVTVAPIPLADLAVRPPVTKEVSSVEASTRLDAVASAGMGMSRSKLKDMVEGGDVLVNWKEATNAAASLKAGDLVTVRGKGRLEVVSIEVTAKERYRVKMIKYV